MKSSNRITRLAEDLAGYWTEPVLETLKAADNARLSVQSEIETWHTVSTALQTALRYQPASEATASLSALKDQVFDQAISELAQRFGLKEEHIRPGARERQSTAAEHALFQKLVCMLTAKSAVDYARQTDFVPRLQLAAVEG
jgi:hypothetical protein